MWEMILSGELQAKVEKVHFSMHRFISIKTVDFIMEILQHCIQRINKENLKLLREVR